MDGFRRLQDRYHREDSLMWSRRQAPSHHSRWSRCPGSVPALCSARPPRAPGPQRSSALPHAADPRTGADLLTEKQQDRLEVRLPSVPPVEVEATWSIYQRMIAAYRHADRRRKAY